jgi:hypothetical protein
VKVLLDLDFGLNPKFQQWITNNCRMRTKRETSTWLRKITEERLSMRDSLEHARCSLGVFLKITRLLCPGTKIFFSKKEK